MIRVFVADDHAIVRAGIRALLATSPDIVIAGEASSGAEVIAFVREAAHVLDVLILDLSLSDGHGVDILRRCIALRPRLAILVHSMYSAAQYEEWVLSEGAAAYLCKDSSQDDVLDAVRSIVKSGGFKSKKCVAPRPTHGHHGLTSRELQIFMMLAMGQSVTDVARDFALSVSTVSTHVANIREKIQVKTVGELVAYAHRHGLVG